MRLKQYLLLFILMPLFLMKCATPPTLFESIPQIHANNLHQSKSSIRVGNVFGGEAGDAFSGDKIDNSSLRSLLTISISKYKLFRIVDSGEDYILDAHILSQQQPLLALNTTTRLKVHYTLKNARGEKLWEKTISSSYTARVSEAWIGAMRLEIANKGALKENVKQLLVELSRLNL